MEGPDAIGPTFHYCMPGTPVVRPSRGWASAPHRLASGQFPVPGAEPSVDSCWGPRLHSGALRLDSPEVCSVRAVLNLTASWCFPGPLHYPTSHVPPSPGKEQPFKTAQDAPLVQHKTNPFVLGGPVLVCKVFAFCRSFTPGIILNALVS